MPAEHNFEFETDVRPARARAESLTCDSAASTTSNTEATAVPPAPQPPSGKGITAALQAEFEATTETPPTDQINLLQLGRALYSYDVWSCSALVERAAGDPNPPEAVEEVLPIARRLIEGNTQETPH